MASPATGLKKSEFIHSEVGKICAETAGNEAQGAELETLPLLSSLTPTQSALA